MRFVIYLCISTVLLAKGAAGQLTYFDLPQSRDIGSATDLVKHSSSGNWIVQSIKVGPNNTLFNPRITVYNPNFSQRLSSLILDSALMVRPVKTIEFQGRIWVCTWQLANSTGFVMKGSETIKLSRLNSAFNGLDSVVYISFSDSLFFVGCEVAQGHLYLYGETKDFTNLQQGRVPSILAIKKINSNLQVVHDTIITSRQGFTTAGSITALYPISEHEFAISGIGQKAWTGNGWIIRQDNGDIAVYDRNFNLRFNDVIHPNPQTAFPLYDIGTRTAPMMNANFIKNPNNQNYYYKGSGIDSTYPAGGDAWGIFGLQKQFMAKLNNQFQITQRHFYGHPGINDIPNLDRALALGTNGRLYSLFNMNFAAWLALPDSIQTLVLYSVDTNFNNPQYQYWHNGQDVQTTALIADASGIYILANSVGRGGEKFHVLRIEGTAWASSSSQQLWPEWGLFPNPARERVFISGEMPSNIGLHDMQGRLIHHWQNTESNELQLPALPPGIYLLHGSNAQGQRWPVRKLVVR